MPILEQYINDESTGVVYLDIKDYRSKAIAESATEDDKAFYENLTGSLSISWVPTLIHVRYGIQVSRYEFLSREYNITNYLLGIKQRLKRRLSRSFIGGCLVKPSVTRI